MTKATAVNKPAVTIPVRNLWYLLLYAWDLAAYSGRTRAAEDESPDLKSLLARALCDVTDDVVRQGHTRAYSANVAAIRGVRGRIDFQRSLKTLAFQDGKAVCRFNQFTVDVLPNRILKATLYRLSRDPNLQSAGSSGDVSALRHRLMDHVRLMDYVTDIPMSPDLFGRVVVHRNNAIYALIVQLCRLVYMTQMPDHHGSDDRSFLELLGQHISRHQLFERFVLNFYRVHLRECAAGSELLNWPNETPEADYLPRMRTDISLRKKTSPGAIAVIDTKFYQNSLVSGPHAEKETVRSSHLYQIYSYLRSQEGIEPLRDTATGVLLYPTVEKDVHSDFAMQGHRILIRSLDLGQPWQSVRQQLIDLANESLAPEGERLEFVA